MLVLIDLMTMQLFTSLFWFSLKNREKFKLIKMKLTAVVFLSAGYRKEGKKLILTFFFL